MRPMSEVESRAPTHARKRLILPYTLWPQSQLAALDSASFANLSFLTHTLAHVQCVSRTHTGTETRASLSMPHEHARAAQQGWPVVDGVLPWAAQAAVQAGLAQAGDGSAWGWVSLCHWQISHGLVTLTDPADLELDEATDAAFFSTLQPFFAEDGLHLHRHLPGVWLVQSPTLADLPTASLERVIGDDVDAWLLGREATTPVPSASVTQWQRLQNEMQMLLYTHPANATRQVPVNSFWLHGTGALPVATTSHTYAPLTPELQAACDALRRAHLMAHPPAWAQAWQRLDAALSQIDADEWVLCGTHAMHTYSRHTTSTPGWHGLGRTLARWLGASAHPTWRNVLAELPAAHEAQG